MNEQGPWCWGVHPQILDQGLYLAQWRVCTPQKHLYPLSEWICQLSCSRVGCVWLSRARSPRLRCTSGSYAPGDGTVNSPARRKPKKPMQAAAHSIRVSGCTDGASHMSRSFISMSGVIGSLVHVWRPEEASTHLIPPSTYSRRGIDRLIKGLPISFCICRQRIADK